MAIKQITKEIIYPRFTTEEMETSRTQCGCVYGITHLFYDDGGRNFPTKAIGYITDQSKGLTISTWNKYGENTTAGKRMKEFDLVRLKQKKVDAAKPFLFGLIHFALTMIITLIWN